MEFMVMLSDEALETREQSITRIKNEIETTVLKAHTGKLLDVFNTLGILAVDTTEEGAEAIRKIKGVESVDKPRVWRVPEIL